jgi:hypothetical protein
VTSPVFAKNGGNYLTGRAATVYQSAFAIVPDDTHQQANPFSAIYVGGAGDVKVVLRNDDGTNPITFKAVPVGTIIPVAGQGVFSTGTSATNLVGLA